MTRESLLDREQRRRPYWVALTRIDGGANSRVDSARPAMVMLDLRGLEFSRATSKHLAAIFDRLTRGFNIRRHDIEDYCLMITPLAWDQDEQVLGEHIRYTPDDRRQLRERSFTWLPVPEDDTDREYAWQR